MSSYNPFGMVPAGFEQVADLSEAVGLTPPPGAQMARINCTGQDVRWRDDGEDPTASVGMLIAAGGEDALYQGDLSTIRFVEVQASAALNVSYYRTGGGILKP